MGKIQVLLTALAFVAAVNARSIETDPLIVGGVEAYIEDHPYHLALLDMIRGVAPTGYM